MNKLSRIIGIAPLAVVLGSGFIAGCGAEAQDEAGVLPEAPNAAPKALCCWCPGPLPPGCGPLPPPPPTQTTTRVWVEDGNLRIVAGSNQANKIGVAEPVPFTLEINELSAHNLSPGTNCDFYGSTRVVRCGVPWYSKIYVSLGTLNDGFWSTTPRQTLVNGGTGNDTIVGGPALDWLDGAAGDDILVGGGGDDVLLGGDNYDTVDGQGGNDTCTAESESNCEF